MPEYGLGRGLGSLIPGGHPGPREVDVGLIRPNPEQPRIGLDEGGLAELADSIRQHGLLQPLIVSQTGEGFTLVAGERRWRAAQMAGLRTVPVVIRQAEAHQRLELALVENLQRQDLSPLEAAAAYRRLMQEFGLSQEQVAEKVGKNRATVANTLRLLQLPQPVQQALASREISEGHARAILAAPSDAQRLQMLGSVRRLGLNVRQTEALARRLATVGEDVAEQPSRADPDLAALEERLRHALGTKVQVIKSKHGGRVVIHFYDDDQLLGLLDALGGQTHP